MLCHNYSISEPRYNHVIQTINKKISLEKKISQMSQWPLEERIKKQLEFGLVPELKILRRSM